MDIISSKNSNILQDPSPNGHLPSSLSLRIGLEDFSLRPVALELNSDTPHALIAGGPGSGRTGVLQTSLLMLASPQERDTKVILVDFRRSSRPLRRLSSIWNYADTEDRLISTIEALKNELRSRQILYRETLENLPNDSDELPSLSAGPLLLLVDDYEQISALPKNPFLELKEFLLQARDLHLHILVAGAPADLGRTDAFLQQIRSCRMGIILGSDPAEAPLLGVRMSDMPPGRGHLIRRNQRCLIQVAHLAPENVSSWIARLTTTKREPGGSKNIIPTTRSNSKFLTV